MTPQDFSDDVCRCGCQDDERGVGARMSLANQMLATVESNRKSYRRAIEEWQEAIAAIYPRRSAVQPEERAPGSVYDSQGYCDNPGRGF